LSAEILAGEDSVAEGDRDIRTRAFSTTVSGPPGGAARAPSKANIAPELCGDHIGRSPHGCLPASVNCARDCATMRSPRVACRLNVRQVIDDGRGQLRRRPARSAVSCARNTSGVARLVLRNAIPAAMVSVLRMPTTTTAKPGKPRFRGRARRAGGACRPDASAIDQGVNKCPANTRGSRRLAARTSTTQPP